MKYISLMVAVLVAGMVPCRAQEAETHKAEFREFYAEFLGAVKTNDKEKLAGLIAFPAQDWSIEGKGGAETASIKDKADFLARYDSLFTAAMRSHIPRAKLSALKDDRYVLIWDEGENEYSFEIGYAAAGGYRITAYDIGPR